MCCLVTIVVILIAVAIYFGRQNVNIFPNPEYTPSDDYLHFLVVGDQGRGNTIQKTVAASMGNYCEKVKTCHFAVGVGDNFYEVGVDSVDDEQFDTKFEQIYGTVPGLKDLKFYMLLGNHDYRGNMQAQIDYTKKSSRWVLPSHFYTLLMNSTLNGFNVSMVMLDTSPFAPFFSDPLMKLSNLRSQYPFKQDQLNLVESTLAQNHGKNDTWTLVFGHHHVYSGGMGGNSAPMVENFVPIFNKYNAPLYIAGHVHLLNWLKDPEHETNYIISGGGSGRIVPPVFNPFSMNIFPDSGFFSVEIQKSFIFLIALDMNGKEIFRFRINK